MMLNSTVTVHCGKLVQSPTCSPTRQCQASSQGPHTGSAVWIVAASEHKTAPFRGAWAQHTVLMVVPSEEFEARPQPHHCASRASLLTSPCSRGGARKSSLKVLAHAQSPPSMAERGHRSHSLGLLLQQGIPETSRPPLYTCPPPARECRGQCPQPERPWACSSQLVAVPGKPGDCS